MKAETPWLYVAEDVLVQRDEEGSRSFFRLSPWQCYEAKKYKLIASTRKFAGSRQFYLRKDSCGVFWGKTKTRVNYGLLLPAEHFFKKHFKLTEEPCKLWLQLVCED